MLLRPRIVLCVFIFFLWESSFSQELNFNFKNISVKDGLTHSDVMSVSQDNEGFLWIGTLAGLNKYDGYELKGFSNKNYLLESVYKNRINNLTIKDNLIWLATEGGIDCFDIISESYINISWDTIGKEFQTNSEIESVYVSKTNKLFATGSSGLKIFNILKNESEDIVLKEIMLNGVYSKIDFTHVSEDENGIIWLISQDNLYYLEETQNTVAFKKVNVINGTENFTGFTALFAKEKNYLLIGVENGFLKANTSILNFNEEISLSTTFYQVNDPLENQKKSYNTRFIVNLFEKGLNNSIWIGSSFGLIECIPVNNSYKYVFYNNSQYNLSRNGIVSLFKDKSGCLWLSNYDGGVNYADLYQKKFHSLYYKEGVVNALPEAYVRAIYEDNSGNPWIGTEKSGLSYYNHQTNTFKHFRHSGTEENSLLSDAVRSLLIDNKKRLWVGTLDGISIYSQKNNRFFNITEDGPDNKSITDNIIFSMDMDKFGNIWAGSWRNGLNRIVYHDETHFSVEKIYSNNNHKPYKLSSNTVSFVYADKYFPEVYVGTDKGLNRIFLNEDGTIKDIINYTGKKENKAGSLGSNFIWPIIKENDSVLWVGTLGGGLNKITLDSKLKTGYNAVNYSTNEGAPSTDIESILFDKENNNLWLGGSGIASFNIDNKTFSYYNEDDGLVGDSFKVGAAHIGKSGRFYFGSTKGLSYFYPREIVSNPYQSNIILTDLIVNNKAVNVDEKHSEEQNIILGKALNYSDKFTIEHFQNNFQIIFSSDHFANPSKSKFKYKLLGYNKDWVFVTAQNRKASFNNLPYGEYVFQVAGTNSDGIWSNKIKTIKIEVLAPWWYTNFAKTLYVFFVLLVLLIGYLAIVRWFKLKKAYEISVLEEKQKEELYQLRAEFFTNISHEFKTPLTLIFNPLEKLISKEKINNTQREDLYQIMFKNAKRLLTLINELIDYRKVNTKVYKLKVANGDLVDFVKDIENYFEAAITKKKHRFLFHNNLGINSLIQYDRAVLEKILFNIVGNAVKFSPDNSRISITLSNQADKKDKRLINEFFVQSEYESEKYIYISIEDNGIGIDADHIKLVFDRFFQSSKNLNTIGGSGIGLTLVKSLVELHKAKLDVYSELGVGTKFVLALPNIDYFKAFPELVTPSSIKLSEKIGIPLSENDKTNNNTDFGVYESVAKPEILLVEDNIELRDFIRDDFQEYYNVKVASNGIEALSVLKENKIQLIISDIMMPEMDGVEFCKRVKSMPKYSNIPFIMLTAKFQVENKIEGIKSGADLYIPKPFSIEVLKLSVENILKSRKVLKESVIEDSFNQARKVTNEHKDDEFLKHLMNTIDENIEDVNFGIDELSKILGVSKSTLYTTVKSITSQSIGSLIRSVRLKKAAQLFSSTDLNVSQVMEKIGIQSQSHFTKSFKKEFGVTPSEFKNRLG